MNLPKALAWLSSLVLSLVVVTAHAVSLSPGSLTLVPGETGSISLSNIRGVASLGDNSTPAVASASLASRRITVTALSAGTTTLTIKDSAGTKTATVTVKPRMTVSPTSASLLVKESAKLTISNPIGTIRVTNSNTTTVGTALSANVLTVTGKAAGTASLVISDSKTKVTIAVTVRTVAPSGEIHPGRLLASNCYQCHGTNGSGGFDTLRGKAASELLSDLREFASGGEDGNGIMAAHALGYTDEQLQLIADFLSRQ